MATKKHTNNKGGTAADIRRAAAGAQRAAFFAAGGDARRWGLVAGSGTMPDRKRVANRDAARGRSARNSRDGW